jgi:hypothetical protein
VKASKDREALLLLHQSTAEPRAQHQVGHYLYFDGKLDAQGAGKSLKEMGFMVTVRRAGDDSAWLVLAVHSIPATEEAVATARAILEDVAEEFQGEYDGWEAATS